VKRLFDVVVASVGLIVAAPILGIAALLIRLDTPGPSLFRQRRVGLGGEEFSLLKLRSMTIDAPALGGHSTEEGDPRITRVGRFIRKASIDELPQLVNVLRGDMSIVGPRPAVPAQLAEYEPSDWARRVSVRPGITGLAQVSGRSDIAGGRRLALDLSYVDNHNLLVDLRICILTLRQLIKGGSN
jgi:lipopolysaccharide/colanic/teichoic acid biosynthesis glycosyltransferase